MKKKKIATSSAIISIIIFLFAINVGPALAIEAGSDLPYLDFSYSIYAEEGVDIHVSHIIPSTYEPLVDETVTLETVVTNWGNQSTGPFNVDLYDNPDPEPVTAGQIGSYQTTAIADLAPGESTTVVSIRNWSAEGTHKLWVQADSSQTVTETNETNNVWGPKTLTVRPRIPDLKVWHIDISKSYPLPDETVTIAVKIKNWGTEDAFGFWFDIYDLPEGQVPTAGQAGNLENIYIDRLDAGESTTIITKKSWAENGAHKIWAQVDTNQYITEVTEENNLKGPECIIVKYESKREWDSGPDNWSWNASKMAKGDFNNDGIEDVALLYGYKSEREVKAFVLRGKAGGGFQPPEVWWVSGKDNWDWEGSVLRAGDFTGDGKDDLAVFYGYKSERDVKIFVFESNGSEFKNPAKWWHAGPGNWDWKGSKIRAGDFNGDGKVDLVVVYGYQHNRDVKAFVFLSDGTKFKGSEKWWHAGAGNWDWKGSLVKTGDFNGDGVTDLIILYGYKSQRDVKAFVFLSDGTKFKGSVQWWHAGAGNWDWNGSKIITGDFDGDDIDDLAIFYGYENARSALFILLSSNGRFSTTPAWYDSGFNNWAWNATMLEAGDFDGDGIDEVVGLYNYGESHSGLFTFD